MSFARRRFGALSLLALPAMAAAATTLSTSYPTWDGKQETVRYTTPDASAALRSYTQSTTMRVREGGKQEISYAEAQGQPSVRSGNLAFDALFTLAGLEMKQDSVGEIRDGSYNGGNAISCNCFETGELWHYVWTRDLSYAASLGLGMLDPRRVRNSLEFKLSGYRDGVQPGAHAAGSTDGLQIIQDTGSGGSWPVSTDRVSWAFGAEEALKALAPDERKAFAATALRALSNTLENDRLAVYDAVDGLYNGEESFLDWREQSYAGWIAGDLASMATSKALSTNAGHYKALTLAAQLAKEQGNTALADKYAAWAADLKRAINQRLWQADAGMYSSVTAGHFDGAPMYKYDWLGQSLAIVTGIADRQQAESILAHYPHGPLGAPVTWPQQPGVAIYHNRAMWPFVTAYGLKAAALTGNVAVADAAYDTLMRGAALNLSNMENLEWLSGQPMLKDKQAQGDLSGPVVDSRRQLWSVGAYLGMVVGDVFGVQTTNDGIALRPFVTAKLRREAFAGSDAVALNNLALRGKRLQVRLSLPPAARGDGYYEVDAVTLNGKPATSTLAWPELAADNVIEIRLGKLVAGQQAKRSVGAQPLALDPAVYSPPEPRIVKLERGTYDFPTLHLEGAGKGVVYNIYRNGKLATQRVSAKTWADRRAPLLGKGENDNLCYSVEAMFTGSGNRSHHSAPVCLNSGVEIAAGDARVQSSVAAADGRIAGWGAPSDTFAVQDIKVERDGSYAMQLKYRNTAHQVNLGISGGVKWMTLRDGNGGVAAQGVVQLPHSPANAGPSWSTPLKAVLKTGSYRMELSDFYNMSYLKSNTSYADAGGVKGPSNRFDIHGVRIMPLARGAAAGSAAGGGSAAASTVASPIPALPPAGTLRIVEQFASPQLGNQRNLRIYLPPGYDAHPQQRYPVLYMHDGQNLFDATTAAYGAAWEMGSTMDRLIADGVVAPAIVVGIDNTKDRIAEYTPCCDPQYGGGKLDAYMAFIVDTVKPWADANLRTLPDREHTAIMGSSLGGIASVYIAQQRPQVFSMAAGVSSSFWWNKGELIAKTPARQPVKFYLDAGTDDDGLEHTLKMRDAMLAQGYRLNEDLLFYAADAAIHNERSWAARVQRPLAWFFPANRQQ
ncbi:MULTISPECIES: alpha/beta hydrolase-fold protein [unclassified Duganella]|uniref:alpha/beta hydrolase-fold protein n=1 Tax=unclassified Duganella TaxID=2636909 RepID=UPI000E34789F|nr:MULTISPECIES: alpha/beta hydrolase-fold protein [unclassified Duganella]RFP15015.1 esterase [Duganella sp. BJB475]RFP31365.1 esterase [Duganella sp. BJB476]